MRGKFYLHIGKNVKTLLAYFLSSTQYFFPSAFEAWLLLSHLLLKREMQP